MGLRSMTVGRYEEIRRRLAEGRGVRECYVRRNRRSNVPFFPEYVEGLCGLRLRKSPGRTV